MPPSKGLLAITDRNSGTNERWVDFVFNLLHYPPADATVELELLVTEPRLAALAESDPGRKDFATALHVRCVCNSCPPLYAPGATAARRALGGTRAFLGSEAVFDRERNDLSHDLLVRECSGACLIGPTKKAPRKFTPCGSPYTGLASRASYDGPTVLIDVAARKPRLPLSRAMAKPLTAV